MTDTGNMQARASRLATMALQALGASTVPREVRIEQDRFKAAVHATQGVLWTNDAEGRMVGEQPGWSNLTGQSREQYEGFGWASAVHPDDAQPTIDAWNCAVAERRTFVFEHRVRRHDGAWRIFAIRAVPVLEDDGSIREWVGVHTDITDLRQAAASLRASNEELRRYSHMISHDLRAPLVNVIGFTSELEASLDEFQKSERRESDFARLEHDAKEALGFIRQGTLRMDRLLSTILKIAREGSRHLSPQPVDIAHVIAGILASHAHQIEAKGASVSTANLPCLVADPAAIEQVLGNLIDNALKYDDPKRKLTLSITGQIDGAHAVVRVSDTGRGISESDFDRIFQAFRRTGPATVAGEGVGLSYVQALTRAMGGAISVESRLGVGSTFEIRLPLHAPG